MFLFKFFVMMHENIIIICYSQIALATRKYTPHEEIHSRIVVASGTNIIIMITEILLICN